MLHYTNSGSRPEQPLAGRGCGGSGPWDSWSGKARRLRRRRRIEVGVFFFRTKHESCEFGAKWSGSGPAGRNIGRENRQPFSRGPAGRNLTMGKACIQEWDSGPLDRKQHFRLLFYRHPDPKGPNFGVRDILVGANPLILAPDSHDSRFDKKKFYNRYNIEWGRSYSDFFRFYPKKIRVATK